MFGNVKENVRRYNRVLSLSFTTARCWNIKIGEEAARYFKAAQMATPADRTARQADSRCASFSLALSPPSRREGRILGMLLMKRASLAIAGYRVFSIQMIEIAPSVMPAASILSPSILERVKLPLLKQPLSADRAHKRNVGPCQ